MSARGRLPKGGRLSSDYVDRVRQLAGINPGVSLFRFTEVVAQRLRMPGLSYATLRVFMEEHGIVLKTGVGQDVAAQRAFASLQSMFSTLPSSAVADKPVGRVVRFDARSRADRSGSDEALERRRDKARRRAVGWVSSGQVSRAARAALVGALAWSQRKPDAEEFDPQCPEDWFDPALFAETVADLFKLGIYELASQAGFEAVQHELGQLCRLDGSEAVLAALRPQTERGLGRSPREPAEGGGNRQLDAEPGVPA